MLHCSSAALAGADEAVVREDVRDVFQGLLARTPQIVEHAGGQSACREDLISAGERVHWPRLMNQDEIVLGRHARKRGSSE